MIQLNESNFAEETMEGVVVVDFGAAWCGPCRMLEPVLKELTGAKICKVDIDQAPALAKQFNVSAVPTIIFFKDGVKASQHVGLLSKQSFQQKIDEVRGSLNDIGKVSVYDNLGKKIGEQG
jgi:thioredoxin 1